MKKIFLLFIFAISYSLLAAQTAKTVLDKTAALCTKGAVQVEFSAKSKEGSSFGTLIAQGNRFTLKSPEASVWFDGKTEWSLVEGSGEVNVVNPTAQEIAAMNPLNFIHLYKKGYRMTMKDAEKNHEIHLNATSSKKSIQEMYIYIDKKTAVPKIVKIRTGRKWTSITVRSFKSIGTLNPSAFAFNPKDFPGTSVIDMR